MSGLTGSTTPTGHGSDRAAAEQHHDSGGVSGRGEGSYVYPADAARDHGADIFRAAVGVTGHDSMWRVDWNTLVDPRNPIAGWALDTNGKTMTGAARWPAQANVLSRGIERAAESGELICQSDASRSTPA